LLKETAAKTVMEENRPGIVRDAATGKTEIHDLFAVDFLQSILFWLETFCMCFVVSLLCNIKTQILTLH